MKIPYDKFQLKMALVGLEKKFPGTETEEEMHEKLKMIADDLGDFATKQIPDEKSEINKKIAEFHGIQVVDLLNSPNYQILCDEYITDIVKQMVSRLKIDLVLNDVEAWAFLARAMGVIK